MKLMFLLKYLGTAFSMVPTIISLTLILFMTFLIIETVSAIKRETVYKIVSTKSVGMLLWFFSLITILMVTGIICSRYGVTSPFDGTCHISFNLIDGGITWSGILNIVLFIPYGFLSYASFKKIRKNWLYALLIGASLSFSIEFLQTFIGRFTQLEDLITNTTGTLAGYFLCKIMYEKLVVAMDLFLVSATAFCNKQKAHILTLIKGEHSSNIVEGK